MDQFKTVESRKIERLTASWRDQQYKHFLSYINNNGNFYFKPSSTVYQDLLFYSNFGVKRWSSGQLRNHLQNYILKFNPYSHVKYNFSFSQDYIKNQYISRLFSELLQKFINQIDLNEYPSKNLRTSINKFFDLPSVLFRISFAKNKLGSFFYQKIRRNIGSIILIHL